MSAPERIFARLDTATVYMDGSSPLVIQMTPYPLTPSEQAEVASKSAKRLLVTVEALQRVTWGIDLSRPSNANAQTGAK